MAVKRFKPTTPTLRHTRLADRSHLAKGSGPRKLTVAKRKATSGRNNSGRITVRHRGGGVKRRLRIVDFKRDKFDIPAKVVSFHYDPNRSAYLALLQYADGEKRYIIAPRSLKVGDEVISGETVDPIVGNAMHIKHVPSGTAVHCVEDQPGKGAVYARSAGNYMIVQGPDASGKYMQVKMSSGEIRLVHGDSMCTIGQVGHEDRVNIKLGKAGRARRKGMRPEVRGMAMYPAAHPHGGGEGKGVIGGPAQDVWGNLIGRRTRKNKRTEKYRIKRRVTKRSKNNKR